MESGHEIATEHTCHLLMPGKPSNVFVRTVSWSSLFLSKIRRVFLCVTSDLEVFLLLSKHHRRLDPSHHHSVALRMLRVKEEGSLRVPGVPGKHGACEMPFPDRADILCSVKQSLKESAWL